MRPTTSATSRVRVLPVFVAMVVALVAPLPATAAPGTTTSVVDGTGRLTITVDAFQSGSTHVSCDVGLVKVDFADPSPGPATACSAITFIEVNIVGHPVWLDLQSYLSASDFPAMIGTLVNGSDGEDTVMPSPFPDELHGGAEPLNGVGDQIYLPNDTGGVTVDLSGGVSSGGMAQGDTYEGFEQVVTGSGNDLIIGSEANNFFQSWGGSDNLIGGGGNDYFDAGDGADTIDGGPGTDDVTYGSGSIGVDVDLLAGTGSGGQATGDTLTGIENLSGTSAADTLRGTNGPNRIQGFGGDDTIDGRGGDDVITPSFGADELIGGSGIDTLDYSGEYGGVITVDLSTGIGSGGNEAAGDTYDGFENVLGGQNGSELIGDDGPNRLVGQFYGDTIFGNGGDDVIEVADSYNSADTVDCGAGNDMVTVDPADAAANCETVAGGTQTGYGSNSVTALFDPATGTTPVTLTFEDVTAGGMSTLSTSTTGPAVPSGFSLGDPPTYFDIDTDAVFSGDLEVCISYAGVSYTNEALIKLYHYDEGTTTWQDVTTSLDTDADIVCGETDSLSPFAVLEPTVATGLVTISGWAPSQISCVGGTLQASPAVITSGPIACEDVTFIEVTITEADVVDPSRVDLTNLPESDFPALIGTRIIGGPEWDRFYPSRVPDELHGDGDNSVGPGDELLYQDLAGLTVNLETGTGSGGIAEGDTYDGFEAVETGSGDDMVTGDGSDNLISTYGGADELHGGAGDDHLVGGSGADVIDGGPGFDLTDFPDSPEAVQVDLTLGTSTGGDAQGDTLIEIEILGGSQHDDTLRGTSGFDQIDGWSGADLIEGRGGGDLLNGWFGDDIIIAADAANSADAVDCGDGIDTATIDAAETTTDCEILIGATFTEPGTDVAAQPEDPATGTTPVTLTFASVTTGGTTTLSTSTTGPAVPSGFSLGDPPTYFDIDTDAVFSGDVEVCISYAGVSYTNEALIKLYHYDEGTTTWQDVTTSLDTDADIVCGETDSLSPFAVIQQDRVPFPFTGFGKPIAPFPTATKANAGSAVSFVFGLGGDRGMAIFAPGFPKSAPIACNSTATVAGTEATTGTLTYDWKKATYSYTWKTSKPWAKTCRQFVMTLTDGTTHRANISFTK